MENKTIEMIDGQQQLEKVQRLLSRKSAFQSLLMKIATDYINIPPDKAEQVMNDSLREIGQFVDADRAYIFDYDHTEKTSSNLFEYCKKGIQPEIDNLQKIPYEMIPDWIDSHFKGELIYIPEVGELPAGNLRDLLSSQGIQSLITLPMMDHSVCLGFVGFDSVNAVRRYNEDEIALLRLYSQMLINLTLRVRNEKEIAEIRVKLEGSLNHEIEVNRMKTSFITMTSHQFRSPITTIQASAELLNFGLGRQDFAGKEKMQKHLTRIFSEVERLTLLINDVHFIGRAESERVNFDPVPTDLAPLVSDLAAHQVFLSGDDRKPDFYVTGAPRPVSADPHLFTQLVINLVSNALKFSSGRPAPTITLTYTDALFKMEVADHGIGIPEKDISRLFDIFYRANNAENINGTGLGLAIASHIVRMHNGRIHASSKLNQGSVFTVEIDLPAEG